LVAAAVIFLSAVSTAGAMHAGLGPMIGVPLGLSFKVYTRPSLAVDAGLGYSWWQDSSVQVHGDLMFGSVNLTQNKYEDGQMGFYMGLGVQVRMAGDPTTAGFRTALRMPLGIEYFFPSVRFSLYAEAVPRFNLGTTDEYFGGDGVFGFRLYWPTGSHRQ
jgi:hypothetical protein